MNAQYQNLSRPEDKVDSISEWSLLSMHQPDALTQTPVAPSAAKLFSAAINYKKSWYDVAISLLGRISTNEAHEELLKALKDEVHTLSDQPQAQPSGIGELLGKKGDIAKGLSLRIAHAVGLDLGAVESQLKLEFIDQLNRTGWTSDEQWIEAELGDNSSSLFNSTIPLNSEFTKIAGVSPFSSFGTSGRSSGSLKVGLADASVVTRVPNGWYTSLRNDQGGMLFDGFRTGTLVNYGELDPERRQGATQASAHQLLKAIALKHLSVLSEDEREEITLGHKPMVLKIASFDLQTWVAQTELPNKFDIERLTIEEQRNAMRDLIGRNTFVIERVSPDGKTTTLPIEVDTEVLSFNFPVHEKSFMDGIGWEGEVAQTNREAVSQLLDQATKKLEELSQNRDALNYKTEQKIRHLMKETQDIFETQAYKYADFDPYKINSRLLNLARLLGFEVVFNCRSGKDRTGFLDGEAKLLAIQLEAGFDGGALPNWERPLIEKESNLLFELLVDGANPKIQSLNSGVPGSKLKPMTKGSIDVDPLVSRIGAHRWAEFKGLSQYADT